jgi:hypothetical protein
MPKQVFHSGLDRQRSGRLVSVHEHLHDRSLDRAIAEATGRGRLDEARSWPPFWNWRTKHPLKVR